MITETLNREAAENLFAAEAIVMGSAGSEGIPQYRIVELFGEPAADFMEENIKADGFLILGKDVNAYGSGSSERPLLTYLCKSGFLKVVVEHNYLLSLEKHRNSEGGALVDAKWKERAERLDAQDRKDAAKRKTANRSKES